ncbi:MAG: hypothetical protein RL347_1619, partial [Actinomycetota bacterium]
SWVSVLMSFGLLSGRGRTGVQRLRDEGAGVGPYWEPLGLVAATKEEALRGHRHEGSTGLVPRASPAPPSTGALRGGRRGAMRS